MKKDSNNIEISARNALLSCLSKIPFLRIINLQKKYLNEGRRPDLVFKIETPTGAFFLIAEVKRSGQPRLAREAVNQLLRYSREIPNSYSIFIAPYISQKAAELCQSEGVGYLDLSGNCLFMFENIYIEKKGNPNKFKEKRDLRSLYSPKAERILRVLLCNPGKKWKIKELAEVSGVSLGQASNVKRLLHDREIVSGERGGFKLEKPASLLKEWAENYDYRKNRIQEFYSLKRVGNIEKDVARHCDKNKIRYALTGFSGAARIAPAVRYKKAMIYASELPEAPLSKLSLKAVKSGGNFLLFTPYDNGVFYKADKIEGIQVASEVQLYLDLQSYRGRGEEAAEALFERIIEKSWQPVQITMR